MPTLLTQPKRTSGDLVESVASPIPVTSNASNEAMRKKANLESGLRVMSKNANPKSDPDQGN
jgi:hypothetical protein